jgi:hypothetical protein
MDMPALPQTEVCIVQAAAHYRAHPNLIRAVLKTEGGKVGQIRQNNDKRKSFDMGPMQINSRHLPELARYGITKDMLVNDECLNIHIGTYYLQRHIVTGSDLWRSVGNYFSTTPSLNVAYQYRVWNHLQKIQEAPK